MIMDYRFTAILILSMCLMVFFVKPAYPRNEYLQNDGSQCVYGSMEASITANETDQRYRIPSTSDYDNNRQRTKIII